MPFEVEAIGHSIALKELFISGKTRVTIDDEVIYEDKMSPRQSVELTQGNRHYSLTKIILNPISQIVAIEIQIKEDDDLLYHETHLQKTGELIGDLQQSKKNNAVSSYAMIGAIIFVALGIPLSKLIPGMPGGAIGGGIVGAIAGGIGAAIGFAIGSAIHGQRSQSAD